MDVKNIWLVFTCVAAFSLSASARDTHPMPKEFFCNTSQPTIEKTRKYLSKKKLYSWEALDSLPCVLNYPDASSHRTYVEVLLAAAYNLDSSQAQKEFLEKRLSSPTIGSEEAWRAIFEHSDWHLREEIEFQCGSWDGTQTWTIKVPTLLWLRNSRDEGLLLTLAKMFPVPYVETVTKSCGGFAPRPGNFFQEVAQLNSSVFREVLKKSAALWPTLRADQLWGVFGQNESNELMNKVALLKNSAIDVNDPALWENKHPTVIQVFLRDERLRYADWIFDKAKVNRWNVNGLPDPYIQRGFPFFSCKEESCKTYFDRYDRPPYQWHNPVYSYLNIESLDLLSSRSDFYDRGNYFKAFQKNVVCETLSACFAEDWVRRLASDFSTFEIDESKVAQQLKILDRLLGRLESTQKRLYFENAYGYEPPVLTDVDLQYLIRDIRTILGKKNPTAVEKEFIAVLKRHSKFFVYHRPEDLSQIRILPELEEIIAP